MRQEEIIRITHELTNELSDISSRHLDHICEDTQDKLNIGLSVAGNLLGRIIDAALRGKMIEPDNKHRFIDDVLINIARTIEYYTKDID